MGVRALIPQAAINYGKHLPLALWALLRYRFPSRQLKIVGVTGTDGKTTTVSLIYHILKEAGLSVGMVSTVSAKIGEKEIDTGFHVTSPNPQLLQRLLRKMVQSGIKYVVMEVTSHGLDQFRFLGINYEIGVLTNVTHEHLDYHQTFAHYLQTKAKLFARARIAVLNRDDGSFSFLESLVSGKGGRLLSYGISQEADFTPRNFPFETPLRGEYNRYNILAAIAAASALGLNKEVVGKAVASFRGIVGRMEEIVSGGRAKSFRVMVDFAHTPNALEQVLKTLREDLKKDQRLIVVFGAAGLRDRGKRPMMGKIAGKLADLVVLTAEDPRTEKVVDICNQIAVGCRRVGVEPTIISNRQEAIEFAIKNAKKGDIVVICGKGHEKSMCFGKKEYPWSDQEAIKKALQQLKPKNE
ncbi:MAG TPA: UDP-N-acetylmuramoyl-L-alanyl-D-glutamate--2,6-diaminopimelate ligase [Patescibacteria group bacterium]|nr:UDP-N-acetylmuramoyl-L-alanyl-D-glutamate--2,6-diaminopimelate ligase [Patescibacteria group bacterium]